MKNNICVITALVILTVCCPKAFSQPAPSTGFGKDMVDLTCTDYHTSLENKDTGAIARIVVWMHGLLSGLSIREDGSKNGSPPGALDENFFKGSMLHLASECRGDPNELLWKAFLKTK